MPKEIAKQYEPHEVEKKWSGFWINKGYFHAEAASNKPPFCMVIPPPNVTGSLHMGHALNNTLQDILARYKRMQGFNVLWLPGTDHAGIATQNVVERELKKEGKTRQDLGREKFIERVWKWKEQHGGQIIHQLKRLGASCDWARERFTMDEGLMRAVREEFVQLYEEGLIYRNLYLINWCPRCGTALSDLEVEHQEVEGSLWFIKYGPLTVATTRPETMLGDTAVAVHPDDERYKNLVGKKVVLPLANREITVIADPRVDKEFGTGAVKVTPAHDFNDFVIGNDHKLPRINLFTEAGKMNENGLHFQGLDRFECRKRIVEELEQKGFLEKIEQHKLSVGHCYRCKTVVEPYLSLQWFVKVKPLAEKALEAVRKGKTKFFPPNWTKTYENWMENIKDWCISRQLWGGHRIPVWYDKEGKEHPLREDPSEEQVKKLGLKQDPDVLDTWFSSALWPFSTLGWPDQTPELKTFYPTSVLITGFDIIFFWVARMEMMGLKFMGEVPFKDVYIHALVRDAEGQKMSKSKGNVIDPLTIMDKFGTDAFRFTLAVLAVPGRDVKLSEPVIEGYRNFCNKIWNAARFFLQPSPPAPLPPASPELKRGEPGGEGSSYDQWILSQWNQTLTKVTEGLEGYRFDEAAKRLYQFFWHSFCDWYLEFSKIRPNREMFRKVFQEALRALHPFMPFITEEVHAVLSGEEKSLEELAYPEPRRNFVASPQISRMIELVTAIRAIRGENAIPVSAVLAPQLWFQEKGERKWFEGEAEVIERLTRSKGIRFLDAKLVPKKMAHYPLGAIDIYVPLEGLVDLDLEKQRLEKEIEKLKVDQLRRDKKLADQGFITHADPETVAQERSLKKIGEEKLERLEETYRNI